MSGIDNPASRADLADRCINVQLESIEAKETEQELDQRFEEKRAGILGGLLSVVSAGLKALPDTKADATIRMSDFCRWIVACEPALGWRPGTFLEFYKQNRLELTEENLDDDSFASALMRRCKGPAPWAVSAQELMDALTPPTMFDPSWPKNAKSVGAHVKRIIPSLRAVGIEAKRCRTGTKRWFEFRRVGPVEPERPTPV